jgi:hypothetical protein
LSRSHVHASRSLGPLHLSVAGVWYSSVSLSGGSEDAGVRLSLVRMSRSRCLSAYASVRASRALGGMSSPISKTERRALSSTLMDTSPDPDAALLLLLLLAIALLETLLL